MVSTPKQRLQQLDQHLHAQAQASAPSKDSDVSENIPEIKSVASDSVGQYAMSRSRERRVMLSKRLGGSRGKWSLSLVSYLLLT